MTYMELKKKANGSRLSRLLIDKGTTILRREFDKQYPPGTLAVDLDAIEHELEKLRYKDINAEQWNILYPTAGSADSKKFDITLLTVLFRTLPRLMPKTSRLVMPRPIKDNIKRIKDYRNEVYAHITTTQIDDVSFEYFWRKISKALVALGIPQREIDELKEAPLSPEEDKYIEQLKEWKKREDEIKEKLDETHGMVMHTHGMVKDMHGTTEVTRGMMEDTHGTMEDTNRMTRDTHGIVKDTQGMTKDTHGMVTDTHVTMEDTHRMTQDTHGMTKDTHGMVKNIYGQLEGISHQQSDENVLLQLANCNFRGNIECLANSSYPGTRDWLLQKVNNWFEEEESESRVMIVTAGPGVGKSVFSAKVCELYKKEGRLAASHFCKFNNSDYRNPHIMLQSLASQMCQSVAGFKEQLIKGLRQPHSRQTIPEAFRVLLNDPLHALKSQKPMVIVIDALDESEIGGKSELLDMIAHEFRELPKWVKFFVTSRPELVVQKKLSHLNPLEICADDKDNMQDLVHYLSGCLSDKCKDEKVIRKLAMKCEGSFLYAYHAQLQLLHHRSNSLTLEDVKCFMCEGISNFYEKQFKRLETYLNELSPATCNFKQFLAVLAAAKGPLPLSLLPTCLGLPESLDFDVRKGMNEIVSAFLPVYDDCLTIYHKSLVDWLQSNGYKEHSYTVSKDTGTEFMWRMCKRQYQEIKSRFLNIKLSRAMEYALKYGAKHFLDLDENSATNNDYECLVDFVIVYLKSFHRFGGTYSLKNDLRNVLHQRAKMDLRLQKKFQWHVTTLDELISPPYTPCSWYFQNVANSSASSVFTGEEIEKARYVLNDPKYVWCENVNDIPLVPAAELAPSQPSSLATCRSSRVTCSSFSPDGSLLATCIDDSCLKVWDVKTCNVLQSFEIPSGWKQGSWWSDEALWILNVTEETTSLLKILVDGTQDVKNVKTETIPLRSGQAKLLSFSQGVLILKCEDDSVLVTKIVGGEVGSNQIFAVDKPVKCATVCDSSLIATANVSGFTLWKEDKTSLNNHWVSCGTRSVQDMSLINKYVKDDTICSIGCDGKFIYSVHAVKWFSSRYYIFKHSVEDIVRPSHQCFDYMTSIQEKTPEEWVPNPPEERLWVRLSTQNEFLIVCHDDSNTVLIADYRQGVLAQWTTPRMNSLLSRRPETSSIPFSSEHNLFAIPDGRGNIQFIKIHFNKEHVDKF